MPLSFRLVNAISSFSDRLSSGLVQAGAKGAELLRRASERYAERATPSERPAQASGGDGSSSRWAHGGVFFGNGSFLSCQSSQSFGHIVLRRCRRAFGEQLPRSRRGRKSGWPSRQRRGLRWRGRRGSSAWWRRRRSRSRRSRSGIYRTSGCGGPSAWVARRWQGSQTSTRRSPRPRGSCSVALPTPYRRRDARGAAPPVALHWAPESGG